MVDVSQVNEDVSVISKLVGNSMNNCPSSTAVGKLSYNDTLKV